MSGPINHSRILSPGDDERCLDPVQLEKLEQSFRTWAEGSDRRDIAVSRKWILLIFLLIRHTGARLNEILHLAPSSDIDFKNRLVRLRKGAAQRGRPWREVEISEALSAENLFRGSVHRIIRGRVTTEVDV